MQGVPIPSIQQQNKIRQLPKIRGVKYNALGLQRANEARQAQGKTSLSASELTPANLGEELTVVQGADTPVATDASPAASPTLQNVSIAAVGKADNSTLNAFPPIRNQGSQGSCAAFSSTYYQMTHMTALVRGWNAKSGGDAYHFSPKWTYNMLNGGTDSGCFIDENLALARDHGCATWSDFPYTGTTSDFRAWCLNAAVWSNSIAFRFNEYSTIDNLASSNGLATLKAVLDNGYMVTFDSYSPWSYRGWVQGTVGNNPSTTNDDPFVGQLICKYVRALDWGHAMTIVGYNDSIWCDLNTNGAVDAGESGALKIANSWGTSWGNSGFAWFAYDALKTDSAVPGWNPSDKVYGAGYGDSVGNCIGYVITARTNYTPRFLSKFTLTHSSRDQMTVLLGKDTATTSNNPAVTWTPSGLNGCGGAYAFDGTTTACDGTFYLDMTDIAPDPTQLRRYFVGMTSAGGTGQLKSYTLIDTLLREQSTVTPAATPTALNPTTGITSIGSAWGWVDMGLAYSVSGVASSATNTSAITIIDNNKASLYPASLTVSGMASNPSQVTLSLKGFTHTYPSDVNMLLVGPGGQAVVLMTRVGGGTAANGLTLTIDDTAASTMTTAALQSRSYKPSDLNPTYTFSTPAPGRPYGTSLSAFTNADPNGIWKLYITDSVSGDNGNLSNGWGLTFTYPSSPSPWIAWETNAFSPLQLANPANSNPLSDPDGDGYCNLVEYAFNSDPRGKQSVPAKLSVHMERINGVLTPVFSYPRRAGLRDIIYTEETSTNLITWSTNRTTFLHTTGDSNGITETVTSALATPPGPQGKAFFRISVSLP